MPGTNVLSLEDQYFQWLYGMIGAVSDRNPSHSHWMLAEQLYRKEFRWFIPNDDNRAADGRALRDDFCDLVGSWAESRIIFEPCNMLEMLIGLSRRIDYEVAGSTLDDTGVGVWFWRMLENVGLKQFTDSRYLDGDFVDTAVDSVLENLIERRYDRNGHYGGLFPLHVPCADQREVELWYQASSYLLENSDIAD